MYLIKRLLIVFTFLLTANCIIAQEVKENATELELGIAYAGSEATYYGIYSKVNIPLTKSKSYFYAGFGLSMYADFIGEISEDSKLKNDVDMRIIPNIYIAYNLSIKRFDFAVEIPIGTSIAITRGTLVNTRVGFERKYSSTNFLWHNGFGVSAKYKISEKSKIGIYGFSPYNTIDDAWSPPMIGIAWIKEIGTKN